MGTGTSRRSFLTAASSAAIAGAFVGRPAGGQGLEKGEGPRVSATFPSQSPSLVREVVAVSHANIDRVRELVTEFPELAKAAQDWGFGDWESTLGAASHMGRRDIAELLIERGARPDLFTFAMLGQLEVVKAFIRASPGIQRMQGPHGFSLLHHARVGGKEAEPVARYLEELGDADPSYTDLPLTDEAKAVYVGEYAVGAAGGDRLQVLLDRRGSLAIQRGDYFPRTLFHQGRHEFHPTGASSVRLRFSVEKGKAKALEITGSTPRI